MLIVNNIKKSTEWEATIQIKGKHDQKFAGLKNIVEGNMGNVTNVLLMHGVRKTEPTHFDSLEYLLTTGLDMVKTKRKQTIVTGRDDKMAGKGKVRIHEYTNRACSDTIRIYRVHWSGITMPAKNMIFKLDKNPYRTNLSHAMKNGNLTDVFGDIALYVSPFRKNIFAIIDTALTTMYEVNPFNDENIYKETPDEIVMITGSFGSKIVFDFLVEKLRTSSEARESLNELLPLITELKKNKKTEKEFNTDLLALIAAEKEEVLAEHKDQKGGVDIYHLNKTFEEIKEKMENSYGYDNVQNIANACENYLISHRTEFKNQHEKYSYIVQKLHTVFMLSNQLPFLSGIDMSPDTEASREAFIDNMYQNIDILMDLAGEFIQSSPNLNIVSFHDPNDVFGYRLPKPQSAGGLNVSNVEFYNTIQWSYNPIKVRQNFLTGITDPKTKLAAAGLFRQDTIRQALNFALQKANASAKNNPYLVNHIVQGSAYDPPVDEVVMVKRKTKGLKKNKKRPN